MVATQIVWRWTTCQRPQGMSSGIVWTALANSDQRRLFSLAAAPAQCGASQPDLMPVADAARQGRAGRASSSPASLRLAEPEWRAGRAASPPS